MTQQNPTTSACESGEIVVPVMREVANVSADIVERGRVRVIKSVREEEQVIERPLMHEDVDVQRVAVNQFVQEAPPARHEGDTLVIPIVEEVLVVEKRLMLKEELRVTKRRTVEPHEHVVNVRIEEARVERGEKTSESQAFSDGRGT